MLNHDKWILALMLDPETGLDPLGIKLQVVQGIDAASSFIQGVLSLMQEVWLMHEAGYWIWYIIFHHIDVLIIVSQRSKIIENLAAISYDTNLLSLASYNWWLSYYNLEVRDGYFSHPKTTIEGFWWVIFN